MHILITRVLWGVQLPKVAGDDLAAADAMIQQELLSVLQVSAYYLHTNMPLCSTGGRMVRIQSVEEHEQPGIWSPEL